MEMVRDCLALLEEYHPPHALSLTLLIQMEMSCPHLDTLADYGA